jgi:putative ATP-dependent endonuclease of the OLD family
MRLEYFSVQKYRSIIKGEKLALGDLPVLVGPNNEGKSNMLQALVVGMEELASPGPVGRRAPTRGPRRMAGGYDWERDFPQALQEAQPSGRSIMDFDFSLTEEEVEEFQEVVGSRLNGNLPIRLQFGGHRPQFSVRKQRHSRTLSQRRAEIAGFVADKVQVQYIPAIRSAEVSANVVRSMLRRELAAAEREESYRDALERVREVQEPILERIASALSEKMRELLPDVQGLQPSLMNGATHCRSATFA